MDRYLTAKARKGRLWDIPVGILSGLMGSLVGYVGIEGLWQVWQDVRFIPPIEVLWAPMLSVLLWTWVALLPLIRVTRWRWRRKQAKEMSEALSGRTEDAIPLADIDRVTGIRNSASKLKKLIRHGFLQKLAIDEDAFCIRLDNPKPETVEPAEPAKPAEPAEPAAPALTSEDYDGIIARIRDLNARIKDDAVSAQIDRIENVTASMFEAMRQRPERAADARRFMSYYLPTTLKLLETYDLMEDQSYQGENITASRRQIEQILSKLVHAVEQQQDKLFQSDAQGLDSDIRVLETMMAADGLLQREEGR